MAIGKFRIALRLDTGFGAILLLVASVIAVGAMSISRMGEMNRQLVDNNWVKAEAASKVAATTAANANDAMALILAPKMERLHDVSERIAANTKAVDDALATLDRFLYTDQSKALLLQIKQQRAEYIASLNGVTQLNADGKHEEAARMMLDTALPALTALQGSIRALLDLQSESARTYRADTHREIESAHRWMLALGILALALGIGCACWIRRSLACPYSCCDR